MTTAAWRQNTSLPISFASTFAVTAIDASDYQSSSVHPFKAIPPGLSTFYVILSANVSLDFEWIAIGK